jgi:uncharacterized membrane protein
MAEWLALATEAVSPILNILALVAIVIGTIEVVVRSFGVMFSASATNHERRLVWLQYARWLVIALTFQLASDIIETAVAPSWDEIGKLAAIAAVRTALNYFLERDLTETRERDREARAEGAGMAGAK